MNRLLSIILAICVACVFLHAPLGAVESSSTKSAKTTPAPKRKATSPAPQSKKKPTGATPRASEKKSGASTPKAKEPGSTTGGDTTTATTPKPTTPKPKTTEKTGESSENADAVSAKTSAVIDPAAPPPDKVPPAVNVSIASSDLLEFSAQPPRVQKLIESALALTRQNLTYTYGSADPEKGGMDCSGFVYYVLRENGFADVPRAANEQYVWVRKADEFDAVLSKKKQSFEFDELQPGDLLFWTGTYSTDRDPPVTHAMIYLGTERASKQRVMVGSSDGRTYRGKSRWGVSVFDFQGGQTSKDPAKAGRGGFVGYASIPGLR